MITRSQAVRLLGQSGAAVSHTGDATETTLATVAIPANGMGKNGAIVIDYDFTLTGVGAKTLRFKLGSTTVITISRTTPTADSGTLVITNRANTASQRARARSLTNSASSLTTATATVDTTAAQVLTITGQLATTTESFTLEAYQVLLYPQN